MKSLLLLPALLILAAPALPAAEPEPSSAGSRLLGPLADGTPPDPACSAR